MDPIKTGKFLAQLRRGQGLTQEALGEKLGVTNKTISRWENGNYMPDIDMLQLLGETFGVTINELLSGRRLSEEEYRERAEENLLTLSRESAFSRRERERYWTAKWRREHRALLLLLGLLVLLALAVPVLIGRPSFACLAPLVALVAYAYLHNKRMAYVEAKLYD